MSEMAAGHLQHMEDPYAAGKRADAAARVRVFLEARAAHYAVRPVPKGHVRLAPDSILTEYGRLDMADLVTLSEIPDG